MEKIEELLGRREILLDLENAKEYLTGKTVLVTGGAGTIGSQLCRQLVSFDLKKLIMLDHNENNTYFLYRELKDTIAFEIVPLISHPNLVEMEKIFEMYKPNVVFHTAAYKQLPLMEVNILSAVKNNILMTYNLMLVSSSADVERFILISTDKAVRPKSIMGTTKKITEILMQLQRGKTIFCAVRFGNVFGSDGSVVPLFIDQIKKGGPVTVTHPATTRYFLTIKEAVQRVLYAGALAKGREIFVFEMGEPLNIMELAKKLIRMHRPMNELGPVHVPIELIGLRKGEKLHEELFNPGEVIKKTQCSHILKVVPEKMDIGKIRRWLGHVSLMIDACNVQVVKESLMMYMEE